MPEPLSDQVVEYRQYRFVPPEGATTMLVIRHGESLPAREDQPADLTDGHADPDLDPVGEKQAQRIAERLVGEDLDALYVTTLRRTAQTIAPLAERLGLTPIVEPDLREVYLGEWEGAAFRKHTSELHPAATGAQNFAFVGADNASISEIVVLGDRWIVRRFNDTAHLENV